MNHASWAPATVGIAVSATKKITPQAPGTDGIYLLYSSYSTPTLGIQKTLPATATMSECLIHQKR
jgi:hypothetical protein